MIPCSVTFLATDEGMRYSAFHIYLKSSKGVLSRLADIEKVSDVQDKIMGFNPLKAARHFLGKQESKIYEGMPEKESEDTYVVSCVSGKMKLDVYNGKSKNNPFKFGKPHEEKNTSTENTG